MEEIWKPLKGLVENGDYYEVSNLGRVRSLDRIDSRGIFRKGKILKLGKNQNGYLQVCFCKNGKTKKFLVHRLVAFAFLPNPNVLPQVNHKDENKQNNSLENLEWCDGKYNLNYGTRNERASESKSKPIKGIHIKTGHTIRFRSALEAERKTGIKFQNISNCIQGKKPHAGFYKWEFAPYQENETNYFLQKTYVAYKAIKQGWNVEKGKKVVEFSSTKEASKAGFGSMQNISQCATYHENPTEFYKKYGYRVKTIKDFIWNIEYKQIPFYE